MRSWASLCICGLFGGLFFTNATVALAEDISLELRDNGFRITGELVSYDGKNYVINSKTLGTLMVSTEKFDCVSGDCPTSTTVNTPPPDDFTLHITGSTTMGYELLPNLIKKYADSKEMKVGEIGEGREVKIELRNANGDLAGAVELNRQGSDAAFDALLKDKTVIGMSAKPITDAQIGKFVKAGYEGMDRVGRQHVIGLDGVLIVTSHQNPISSLSLEEISRIFSGEINNWSEFGMDDLPIHVYSRNSESSMAATFRDLVLKPYKRTITGAASAYLNNAEVAEAVAADRGGVGFVGFAEEGIAKTISIKDTCGIVHQPTRFFVKAGEYPLSRSLYFYTADIYQPAIADFVGFAVSEDGQKTIEEAGFINRRITTASFVGFHDRVIASMVAPESDFDLGLMRQLMQDLRTGSRLSATIRFEVSGSEAIDAASSQQLSSIINYISNQDLTRYKVLLAGFSDTTGLFASNVAISLKRANAVRDALLDSGRSLLKPEDIVAKAYGKLFPVACNDTSEGRSKNRRVEVWLVPRHAEPVALNRQP